MSGDIRDRCEAVAEAAVEGQEWLDHPSNRELVGAQAGPARRSLRRAAIRARKLARAAGRPMCVSVFGPSQAGKSFLVSVLARPPGGKLESNFPDLRGRLDFIRDINPEGEGESTGLVTRFTVHSYQAPAGYPVKLRLLSEADVARLLVNTFQMDGDKSEKEPTREEIDELVKRLGARAAAAPTGGLSAEDVIETQEYVKKAFGKAVYVAALEDFWEEAIDLAPRLPIAERAQLLAVIWGRHEAFTKLYSRLAKALADLDHPEEAFAGLDALQPREDSIIDVKQLAGLDQEGGAPLELVSPEGRRATLAKPVVTALTAELVLPMAEKPHDLFEGTDLLDFPGARTRFEQPLDRFLAKASGPLKECVLRGKVAYLFDRYVADQEITAMMLCIPGSNMEIADLPGLVADWISYTHGASPEARAQADKLLFFVLTKFDMHLVDSAGSSDDATTRFQRRIQASLLEKFAPMAESWPLNWASDAPFDNCFWLRNPNFPAEAVIVYEQGREVAYNVNKKERLEELRAGCVGAELVQRHFRDPEAAWHAAMALDDGGVSYLIENLTPVCRPEIKSRQIAVQLAETGARLGRELARFHVSDDLTKRLHERRAAAQALMAELLRVFEHRLFGALLDELTLHPEPLAGRLKRQPTNVRFVSSPVPAPAGGGVVPSGAPSGGAGAGIVLPGGGAPVSTAPPPSQVPARADEKRTLTRSQWRAETAFAMWVATVKAFAAAEDIQQRFSLSPDSATELAGELIAGARRCGLESVIERELDSSRYVERNDASVERAALIASEALNGFVVEAGAAFLPVESRPDIATPDGTRKPFAPREVVHGVDGLPETPRRPDADYLTDWMHMIYRMFEDNARDTESGAADPEQNERLGRILQAFAAA